MKNYVDRWDSDVFENKEISKLIYQMLKNLKLCLILFMDGEVSKSKYDTIFCNEHGLRNKSFKNLDKGKKPYVTRRIAVWGFGASLMTLYPQI